MMTKSDLRFDTLVDLIVRSRQFREVRVTARYELPLRE